MSFDWITVALKIYLRVIRKRNDEDTFYTNEEILLFN